MPLESFIWCIWANAILSGTMAFLVLLSRPLTRVKALWSMSCLCVCAWAIALSFMVDSSSREAALTALQFVNLFSILLPLIFLHTVVTLLNSNRKNVLLACYVFSAVLMAFNYAGELSTVQPSVFFRFYNHRLWPYDWFLVHFYGWFAYAEWLIWHAYRKTSDPQRRKQLRLVLIGIGTGVLGGQTTIPLVYGIPLYPFGVPFISVYVLTIGWGMLRHQLLDVRFALRRFWFVGVIYGVAGILILPFARTSLTLLRNAAPEFTTASLTLSFLLAILVISGPFFYILLTRRSTRVRTFLSAGFSHDIRSPLASIASATEIIRSAAERPSKDWATVIEYAAMIDRNVEQLQQFSTGMLALMKSDDGSDHPKAPMSVQTMTRAILDEMSPLLKQKSLQAHITIPDGLVVVVNPEGFRSIVSNLLSNAIRFSEGGTISIEATSDSNEAVIRVSDTGAGLPAEAKANIFEQFFQLDKKKGGTGLGLTIAKHWVEVHGGRIWAESEGLGKGTTMTFTLPVGLQR